MSNYLGESRPSANSSRAMAYSMLHTRLLPDSCMTDKLTKFSCHTLMGKLPEAVQAVHVSSQGQVGQVIPYSSFHFLYIIPTLESLEPHIIPLYLHGMLLLASGAARLGFLVLWRQPGFKPQPNLVTSVCSCQKPFCNQLLINLQIVISHLVVCVEPIIP